MTRSSVWGDSLSENQSGGLGFGREKLGWGLGSGCQVLVSWAEGLGGVEVTDSNPKTASPLCFGFNGCLSKKNNIWGGAP